MYALLLVLSSLSSDPVKTAATVYQTEFAVTNLAGTSISGEVIGLLQTVSTEDKGLSKKLIERVDRLIDIYRNMPSAERGYKLLKQKLEEGLDDATRRRLAEHMARTAEDLLQDAKTFGTLPKTEYNVEMTAMHWGKLYAFLVQYSQDKSRETLRGLIVDEVDYLTDIDPSRKELYQSLRKEVAGK